MWETSSEKPGGLGISRTELRGRYQAAREESFEIRRGLGKKRPEINRMWNGDLRVALIVSHAQAPPGVKLREG
jgi:hypothetical protein